MSLHVIETFSMYKLFCIGFSKMIPEMLKLLCTASEENRNYKAFSLITSGKFIGCFMIYISDIFGLGNSFRRMSLQCMLLFFY